MADGTRATQMANRVASTEEQLAELLQLMCEMQLRLTLLEAKQDQQPSPSATPPMALPVSLTENPANSPFKSIRITIPRFSGGNPETWIQKIEHYYSFHSLSDTDKLLLTSFHMDGPAEEWYLWLTKTNRVTSWVDFLQALHTRFGPSKYRDLRGELAKLLQTSSVEAYQLQFESLSNQITGLDELFLQSCFESGLQPAIRREVRLHRPTSLDQAIELSKLIEDKLNDGSSPQPPPTKAPPPYQQKPPLRHQPPPHSLPPSPQAVQHYYRYQIDLNSPLSGSLQPKWWIDESRGFVSIVTNRFPVLMFAKQTVRPNH